MSLSSTRQIIGHLLLRRVDEAGVRRHFGVPEICHLALSLQLENILALPQLQNRLRVQDQRFWSYLSGQRSSWLIHEAPSASAAQRG